MSDSRSVCVVDFGSFSVRAGVSSESTPSLVCRSLVARRSTTRGLSLARGSAAAAPVVGRLPDAHVLHEYTLSSPLLPAADGDGCGGAALDVAAWPDVGALLEHALTGGLSGISISSSSISSSSISGANSGGGASERRPVLLSEPVFASLSTRERTAQILFEQLDVPALCLVSQPLLTLYACGVASGLTLDVGLHSTRVVPVVEGRVLRDAAQAVPVGGLAITSYLQALVRDHAALSISARDANALKEAHAYVVGGVDPAVPLAPAAAAGASLAADNDDDAPLDEGPDVELPAPGEHDGADTAPAVAGVAPSSAAAAEAMTPASVPTRGTIFTFEHSDVGHARDFDVGAHAALLARCTEPLFDPSLVGRDAAGLAETMASVVLAVEPAHRAALLSNVCLAGGSTALRGFGARVLSELRAGALLGSGAALAGVDEATFPYMLHVAPGERHNTNWLGGAIVTQLNTHQSCWCPKSVYDEQGPFSVHSRVL
jgi:actin-related protein